MPELGWNEIHWKPIELNVTKLQQQIYLQAKERNIRTVRRLQHGLLRHPQARLLAVRKVTQDNRGKVTAGVDGIKSLPPQD
jgi:RNA-directed DNA polymerase